MSILPPKTARQRRGTHAEDQACRYLQRQGLRLIERNYRSRRGEIDLIMRDADSLVFVEVRYRRQHRYGSGLESVDRHKQRRIAACAAHYLLCHPQAALLAARFDVVALTPGDGGLRIDWIRNAFDTG
jgi:putative endonuclease